MLFLDALLLLITQIHLVVISTAELSPIDLILHEFGLALLGPLLSHLSFEVSWPPVFFTCHQMNHPFLVFQHLS